MRRSIKAFLVMILIFIVLIAVIVFLAQKRAEEREAETNVTEEVKEEPQPRQVIERPVIKDWQFIVIIVGIFFVGLIIAKPHWFRKLPMVKRKDIQDYYKEVYMRMLIDHRELFTGSSDKIIQPRHHFLKKDYYFVQIPDELLNYPESGGLPMVIVYNRDLGTIEGKLEFNMRSPITSERIRKYLVDKFVEKKEVPPPPEMVPSVVVTPIGTQYEYT